MSLENNKVLVQRFIDEVFNVGNTAAMADFCIPGSMFVGGIEGQAKVMKLGFPDNHFTIDDILAEGNKVAIRVTINGTNTGPLVGLPAFGKFETPLPPTGKSMSVSGMMVFTVKDGKIVSFARELDNIGMLQQLGWTFTPPDQT